MATSGQKATHHMSDIDDALGRFDEDSRNPFFGLQDPGIQWPEERAFMRGANPYAMARLSQVLVGFQGFLLHGANLGDPGMKIYIERLSRERLLETAQAIATVLETIRDIAPQILSDTPVSLDRDWDLPPYTADSRLEPLLEDAISRAGTDEEA